MTTHTNRIDANAGIEVSIAEELHILASSRDVIGNYWGFEGKNPAAILNKETPGDGQAARMNMAAYVKLLTNRFAAHDSMANTLVENTGFHPPNAITVKLQLLIRAVCMLRHKM